MLSTVSPELHAEALEGHVRERLFRDVRTDAPARVAMEVEVLPVDAATGSPCPILASEASPAPGTAPLLGAWARERGWVEARAKGGTPAWRAPGGATLSYEPGGQIEYSSPAVGSLRTLSDDVSDVMGTLARRARDHGIEMLARGLDPHTPLQDAQQWVNGERYRRMARHYARLGQAGRRMMLQTAAIHVNLDLGPAPLARWSVATRVAPFLTALFANSPSVAGAPSGERSARALQWRRLDPSRTGVPTGDDAPRAYLEFALAADAFLMGPEDQPARPFRYWLGRGATATDWALHLTTLFPDVRPRGYLEFRCIDALPLRWYGVPAALAVGLLYDPRARAVCGDVLPAPEARLRERAGRLGVADPEIRAHALALIDLAIDGLSRLREIGGPAAAETLEYFRNACPELGLDPGHHPGDGLID